MVGEDDSYPVQVGELRVCSDAQSATPEAAAEPV
jgi:hypothetical protein